MVAPTSLEEADAVQPGMAIYCAYCGKKFSRKEHLERHIPSHTNVKPHRCGSCQLSFARRDLLQRHYTTYHEIRDDAEPMTGGVPQVPGRTPIACQNCASAKTGCDKRVPCTRCSEKGLECAARFARRSAKHANRVAQAAAGHQQQLKKSPPQLPETVNPLLMDMEHGSTKAEPAGSPATMDPVMAADRLAAKSSPSHSHSHTIQGDFPSPHTRMEPLDEYMPTPGDVMGSEALYQDFGMMWPDYTLDMDMYAHGLPVTRPDMMMPFGHDLSDLSAGSEIMTGSTRGSIHTRGTSIISSGEYGTPAPADRSMREHAEVVAAEAAWNVARCNKRADTSSCPRTAIVHLECLERQCKQEGTWSSIESYVQHADWNVSDMASVVPLAARTRDKMLAITQSFLHKALDTHRGAGHGGYSGQASPGETNFIMLPPSEILEYFLRSYVRSLSLYYPLVVGGKVDPNEMLQDNQASTLLMLLMIAQGAAAIPVVEARYLSAGLTETCRISLFNMVEKNVELSADPITLRCALLFIVLGAWSGDKWHMDIAMGQRNMYMAMLKHAGMLDPQPPMVPAPNLELQWHDWVKRESQNRLVYNYVMLDQELSLFHDTAPLFAVKELECPLPHQESLWGAPTAASWMAAVRDAVGGASGMNQRLLSTLSALTPSLKVLFDDFISDSLGRRQLSPQQLRLLLHPLQAVIFQQRQLASSVADRPGPLKAMAHQQLDEALRLLQQWYNLTTVQPTHNANCPVTRCNMALFHLIYLNAVTDFPEIEKLARRELFDGSFVELSLRVKRCFYRREDAIYHCGQALQWLRIMPSDRRPAWWSLAMYRTTLILWSDSLLSLDPNFQPNKPVNVGGGSVPIIPIDQPGSQHVPAINDCLLHNYGIPVLSLGDGSHVALDKPSDVLGYAVKNIEDGCSTRMGDGIKRKLIDLNKTWVTLGATAIPVPTPLPVG